MQKFKDENIILYNTNLIDNFIQYVKIDTTSNRESKTYPSTKSQFKLANLLVEQLKKLGIKNAKVNEYCYVYAHIKSNCNSKTKIAFIAHLDTSPDCVGKNVKPMIHKNYTGDDIVLDNGNLTITPQVNEYLKTLKGHDIITSDGTTLLGGDDKAGIAEIMAFIEFLNKNPDIKHPNITICFTPDEEINRGVEKLNLKDLDCDFGLTIDGTMLGEVGIETFSGKTVNIHFQGFSVHPGMGKNKLINALRYAGKFLDQLFPKEDAYHTDGREGFFFPLDIKGDYVNCDLRLIVVDFDEDILNKRIQRLKKLCQKIDNLNEGLHITIDIQHRYKNMYHCIKKYPDILKKLFDSIKFANIKIIKKEERGSTDGAKLANFGIPVPNIFNGVYLMHSNAEFVSIQNMGKTVCTLLNFVQLFSK